MARTGWNGLATMLTLYHSVGSPSTRVLYVYQLLRSAYRKRQEWALRHSSESVALPPTLLLYEFPDAAQLGTQAPDWFLRDVPSGKVPLLLDRGVVLWDSCAICTHLLDNYDPLGLLLPRSVPERALSGAAGGPSAIRSSTL